MDKIYKHYVTNITSDKVVFSCIRESDGKVCEIHELIADRSFPNGDKEIQTCCVVNQREYEEIQQFGYYNVYNNGYY